MGFYTDSTLADFTVGQNVRAFHPNTVGVMYAATVVLVGRKYVTVRFGIDGRTFKLHPKYVVGQ